MLYCDFELILFAFLGRLRLSGARRDLHPNLTLQQGVHEKFHPLKLRYKLVVELVLIHADGPLNSP
jgi:hypothetical protein